MSADLDAIGGPELPDCAVCSSAKTVGAKKVAVLNIHA
jgi:hypothetical protein